MDHRRLEENPDGIVLKFLSDTLSSLKSHSKKRAFCKECPSNVFKVIAGGFITALLENSFFFVPVSKEIDGICVGKKLQATVFYQAMLKAVGFELMSERIPDVGY